jgi:transposase
MRPKGTAEQLAARRRLAIRLWREGRSVEDVARVVGVHPSSIRRWKAAVNTRGWQSLQGKPHPGRSRRLSAAQELELQSILRDGLPESRGATRDWNCSTVASVIQERFGIAYHVDHVWRLLRRIGWSYWEGRGWVYEGDRPSER